MIKLNINDTPTVIKLKSNYLIKSLEDDIRDYLDNPDYIARNRYIAQGQLYNQLWVCWYLKLIDTNMFNFISHKLLRVL